MTLSAKTLFFVLFKMVITSRQNSKVAFVAKLAEKKYRKAFGKYVIEGERLVKDALLHGAQVTELYLNRTLCEKLGLNDEPCVADVCDTLNFASDVEAQVFVTSDDVFAKMSDTVNSQGVIAVADLPENNHGAPKGNCLVLDGLQDPGNVGTLIRTAAACDFSDVFAVNSVDLYSPKVLRSAMSAHFCVKLQQFDDISVAWKYLSDTEIVAADMNGQNVAFADFFRSVALVVGNEGNGISDFCRTNADKIVSLPMKNDFESLNAGVAGSVLMYQIFLKQANFSK